MFRIFLIVFFIGVILFTSLIFFLSNDKNKRYQFQTPVLRLVQPISETLTYPFVSALSFFSDFYQVESLRNENTVLKEQLLSLELAKSEIESLREENKSLRDGLKIKKEHLSKQVLTSRVLTRSTVSWLESFTIDLGEQDGVSENMLVVSDGALVGIVSHLFKGSSRVSLLSNTGFSFNIPIKLVSDNKDYFGILTEFDFEKQMFKVINLNTKEPLSLGSKVLTSGLDGNSASNILVGEMVELENKDSMTDIVYVRPAADFSDIDFVNLVGE